jgi:hypothetical protein
VAAGIVTVGDLPKLPVAVTDVLVTDEPAEDEAEDDADEDDAPEEDEDDPQPAMTATASKEVVASAATRRRRMETSRVWRVMSVCPGPAPRFLGSGKAPSGYPDRTGA